VRLLTVITISAIIVILFLLAIIYFSFAAAFALAGPLGYVAAFSIIGGLYMFLLVLFIVFRHQWIEKPLVHFLASLLLSK
jgi:hypothetical protein